MKTIYNLALVIWKFLDGKKLYISGVCWIIIGCINDFNAEQIMEGLALVGIKSALVKAPK